MIPLFDITTYMMMPPLHEETQAIKFWKERERERGEGGE